MGGDSHRRWTEQTLLGGGSEHSSVIMEGQKPRNHAVTLVPRTGEGRGLLELMYMSCTRLLFAFPPITRYRVQMGNTISAGFVMEEEQKGAAERRMEWWSYYS